MKKEAKVTNVQFAAVVASLLHVTMSLSLAFREGHWNIKGPHFDGYHSLYGDIYAFLDDASDLLAERVVQLGGYAMALNQIPESTACGTDEVEWLAYLTAGLTQLSDCMATVAATISSDETTKDILIETNRAIEKWIWKLESHKILE